MRQVILTALAAAAAAQQPGVVFRADSQNFTNHVSFTGLGTVVNASNYGLPAAAQPMRTMTLTMRLRF